MSEPRRSTRTGRWPVFSFLVAALALAAAAAGIALDAPTPLVAAVAAFACLAAAAGLTLQLTDDVGVQVPLRHAEGDVERRAADVARSAPARRTVLVGAGAAGAGVAGLAVLGPEATPGTRWRRGAHLVTPDGRRLLAADVPEGGMATAFPEGSLEDDRSAVVLVRLQGEPRPPTVLDWVVEDLVAYSKVCTHAGCAVGLFRTGGSELYCPCHQGMFAADRGATPTFGPVAVPLPQLPLGIDAAGYLIALDDFNAPVGPARG